MDIVQLLCKTSNKDLKDFNVEEISLKKSRFIKVLMKRLFKQDEAVF